MPTENIKITVSTEDLDAKLSKSMRELGAHHDQYGRLLNAEGKYISGLSQARIRMGDYIDAQGRMRDAADNYLDGLSNTELKLRMYCDELGNVYNAEGELVRVSEELARVQREELAAANELAAKKAADAAMAQKELATAGERGMKSLTSAGAGAAEMANNLSLMLAVLGGNNAEMKKFSVAIMAGAQGFAQFSKAMEVLPRLVQGFKLLTLATQGQTAAQVLLKLVTGNWIAVAAGALAAGTIAYKTLASSAKKTATETSGITEQLNAVTLAFKNLQSAQTGADRSMSAGVLAASISEGDLLTEQVKKAEDLKARVESAARSLRIVQQQETEYKEGISKYREGLEKGRLARWTGAITGLQTGMAKFDQKSAEQLQELGKQRDALAAATAGLAETVRSMTAEDLPRNELKVLQDRADAYAKILESAGLDTQARALAERALAENQRKQAELIAQEKGYGDFLGKEETKIVLPATQAELDAAIKKAAEDLGTGTQAYVTVVGNLQREFEQAQAAEAAKKLADAQRALGDRFASYADGSALYSAEQKAAAELENTIKTWKENFEAAGKSQDELDAAIKNLTQEYDERRLQQYLESNGLHAEEQEHRTALEQYTDTLNKIKEAQETYGLQAAEAEKLRAQAAETYADELRKKADEEKAERERRLGELGITQLRESVKTPFQKFLEQQQKVSTALQEGLIGAAEAQQFNAKLAQDYLEQQTGAAGPSETGLEKEEAKAASNLAYGSNELYQAMTSRESTTERYQTGVTKNLDSLARYTNDNNQILESIRNNIGEVMKAVGVV